MWMDDDLTDLESRGLYRRRRRIASAQGARIRYRGRELVNFAGNDYLNLAGDPRLARAGGGTVAVSSGPAGRLPDGFRVAIVGAGVAGLSCGSALQARGARVVV